MIGNTHYLCFLQYLGQRLTRSLGFHQTFADQERFVTGGPQTTYICAGLDAAFGHPDTSSRYFLGEPECGVEVHLESLQIAAVHADQITTGIKCALQFPFIMGFA